MREKKLFSVYSCYDNEINMMQKMNGNLLNNVWELKKKKETMYINA